MPLPPRHTLAWPDSAGRRLLRQDAPSAVADWAEAGLPLVVRRRAPGDRPDHWPLAVSLPPAPDGARARYALQLPAGFIDRHAPPPLLSALLKADNLPAAWQPGLRAVQRLGETHGISPRVFGSAMWQFVSGQTFLRPGSDLDLLWLRSEWRPDSPVPGLLAGLLPLADAVPRLDGEILFPDGAGVQWRELATAAPDANLLIKTADAVRLVAARTLLDPVPA